MNYRFLLLLPVTFVLFAASAPKLPKKLKKTFSFVPSGLAVVGKDTLSLQAFYMQNFEVSNAEYQTYLDYLEKKGDKKSIEQARVRNENWNQVLKASSFAEIYHTHSAFAKYPVVNVTYAGAQGYCKYMTEKLNALFAKSGIKVKARLPFHAEIIRAGVGDNHSRKFPWEYTGVRNNKGEFMSNHVAGIVSNGSPTDGDNADVLAPVKSYWPSPLGVYNLSGNAAEMTHVPGVAVGGSWRDVAENVTLQSMAKYEDSAPTVGFRVVFTWQAE